MPTRLRLSRKSGALLSVLVLLVGVLVTGVFLYMDRHDTISKAIHDWGTIGIVVAILLMALLCLTPIPSEGLLVVYMKVYGVWAGVIYSWIGATLSAVIIFAIARQIGRPLLESVVTKERFAQVDKWVQRRGIIGLLIARLLPFPAFAVNYVAGLIPSITFSGYFFTALISIIPYYLGAAFIFLGVSKRFITWLLLGISAFVIMGLLRYRVVKKKT